MKNISTIILLLTSLFCFGQKQNNNWCFGNHAGISFNSGSPVAFSGVAISQGQQEGVSAISDVNGNLLFYTDGASVWNKNNVQMTNGTGLLGNFSTSEGALIVPKPGSSSIYYVFTLDQVNGPNGLHYSVVDMTLNGGLGDVSQKNIALSLGTLYGEKMIGIFHTNATDVWVIVHKSYVGTFHSYKVTAAGVDTTPVASTVGQIWGIDDAVGTMHCTLDGSRIAASYWAGLNGYELFDFDRSTGQLSNSKVISSPNYNEAYSVCFSPSGRYLYGGCFNTDKLYQFDLMQANPVGVLITTSLDYVGEMQLGPDSIIYVSLDPNTYLSAIESPDSPGVKCNFVANAVNLNGGSNWIGLNNYIYPAGAAVLPPTANFAAADTFFCEGICTSFTNLSQNAVSYQWLFQGGIPASDTAANPASVCYYTHGAYNVSLIATNAGGNNTLTFTNYINVNAAPPTPSIRQVHTDTLIVVTDTSYISYQWVSDSGVIAGATDTFLVVSKSGNYDIKVTNKQGCSIAAGITITLGLMDFNNNYAINVFPDPVKDELYINNHSLHESSELIILYNTLGEVVLRSPSLNGDSERVIDVSLLPSGVYFIRLLGEKESFIGRFVKE